jgi:hypothetical protein
LLPGVENRSRILPGALLLGRVLRPFEDAEVRCEQLYERQQSFFWRIWRLVSLFGLRASQLLRSSSSVTFAAAFAAVSSAAAAAAAFTTPRVPLEGVSCCWMIYGGSIATSDGR